MSTSLPVNQSTALPGWKRSIDIVAAVTALPALAICTVGMAVVIGATSPGPIFFRQQRVGHRGKMFLLYKFRTMRLCADNQSHQAHMTALLRTNCPMQKLDECGDPRLIPCGWLLRASGLDELPQMLNVLQGDMSLVGPRPCVPYEYDQYTPEQRQRCNAVPGLTGLWQVSGKNRTTFDTMVRLDIAYAEQTSLWLDLRIITLTFPALLRQVFDTSLRRLRFGRSKPTGLRSGERTTGATATPNFNPAHEQP